MNKLSLGYIIKKEFNELFNNDNKVYIPSFILTIILWLMVFFPIRDEIDLLTSIVQEVLDINTSLLGVSIGYIIFVITLVFTGWSKEKLINIYNNNESLFVQIFSPYLVGAVFVALNVFISFIIRYSIFEWDINIIINRIVMNTFLYGSIIFILFFGAVHSVMFLLYTLVLFIKDMARYTKIELENQQENKEKSEFDLFIEYAENNQLALEKLTKENKQLKERIEELEKK